MLCDFFLHIFKNSSLVLMGCDVHYWDPLLVEALPEVSSIFRFPLKVYFAILRVIPPLHQGSNAVFRPNATFPSSCMDFLK